MLNVLNEYYNVDEFDLVCKNIYLIIELRCLVNDVNALQRILYARPTNVLSSISVKLASRNEFYCVFYMQSFHERLTFGKTRLTISSFYLIKKNYFLLEDSPCIRKWLHYLVAIVWQSFNNVWQAVKNVWRFIVFIFT